MKKVYYSLLILFIVLLFISPVIFAEPNTDLNVLLYSEDKEDTATHFKLYTSDEVTSNKSIIYSVIITASVPSPLGQGNVIDQGLVALVIPETAEVDYKNIKVYGAPTPDSNKYVEYQPESKSTKELFDILGLIISKIPFLGLVMDIAPIYQVGPGGYGEFIDLNQYDIVKVNWEAPRLEYWQKVQIDIPIHLGDDVEIGLYAYWQSRASSSDGTGPTFARDNMVNVGFNISEEKLEEEVVSRVEKLTWDKTYGGNDSDGANSLIQTTGDGYAIAGVTCSYGAGETDLWVIKLDSRGNKLWDKTFGGSNADWAEALIQTTDGGYAVAGNTQSYGAGETDLWVIKLDDQGNLKPTPEKELIYEEKSKSKLIKKGSLKLVITTSLTSIFSSVHRDLIVTIVGQVQQSKTIENVAAAKPVTVYFNDIPEGHYQLTAQYGSDQITKELDVFGDTYEFSLVFY